MIRSLEFNDLDALLQLYTFLHPGDDAPPERKIVEQVWQQALTTPGTRYLGGFVGTHLVSSCNIVVIANLTRACRPYGVIENVVTDPQFRQQGWGKRLLAAALEYAWAERCYKVVLTTSRSDEATLRFYENAGFNRHDKKAFIARAPD